MSRNFSAEFLGENPRRNKGFFFLFFAQGCSAAKREKRAFFLGLICIYDLHERSCLPLDTYSAEKKNNALEYVFVHIWDLRTFKIDLFIWLSNQTNPTRLSGTGGLPKGSKAEFGFLSCRCSGTRTAREQAKEVNAFNPSNISRPPREVLDFRQDR